MTLETTVGPRTEDPNVGDRPPVAGASSTLAPLARPAGPGLPPRPDSLSIAVPLAEGLARYGLPL